MTSSKRSAQPLGAAAAHSACGPAQWSERDAERHLRSMELFGMRFGLDRMRRMMTVLDSPPRRFQSLHVLGTNGKSSTTRMIAAILERHGLRTGTYTSPHLVSYRERLQIGERDVEGEEFAAAIARAAWAAERVNRTLGEDDHVTQFELLTAGALWAMAERGVQVAVVEAGLGGRYDATSVIESRITALTNVGLEHTRWLGPTLSDIAEEKLAVLQPQGTLVLGAAVAPEALAVAERLARERRARIVRAGEHDPMIEMKAAGAFQQRNFALARLAAETYLQGAAIEPQERLMLAAARATEVRGRLQVVDHDPLTVLDGAHNPAASAALVDSLPELLGERPLALVLGVLDDKDAAGMLKLLLAVSERAWFTAPPGSRALSPAALQSLARQLGFERVACDPRPARALADAQRWARERGGAVLATGSVYLVGELLGALEGTHSAKESERHSRRTAI
jgi:dihydrofolate synthase/folylpolyglutamate synthase